jgi:5-methylcytosine-specific restriction endonuclease McrA
MAEGRGSAQLSLPFVGSGSIDEGFAHPDGAIPVRGSRSGRGKDSAIRCRQCRRSLDVPRVIREAGVSLHYCDDACRQAWVESEPDLTVRTGQRGGSQRGGNWDLQTRMARERDQFTCRICGVTEEEIGQRLHVHHRIPYRRFRSNVEANKLEHLISVCPSCHRRQESELSRELPLFSTPT